MSIDRDWSRWAIVPRGVHVILAARQAHEYGMYLCKMFDPDEDTRGEYHMLVDSDNIYESRQAAERKVFHNKLKGEQIVPPTSDVVTR